MAKKIVGLNGTVFVGTETVESIHVEYVTALKSVGTARAVIAKCVERLGKLIPDRKQLRDTLIAWAVEAGAKKLTASGEVSRQMVAAGLGIRAKGGGRKAKAKTDAAARAAAWDAAGAAAGAAPVAKAPALTTGGGPLFILNTIKAAYPGISPAELAGVLKQAYLLAVEAAL